MAGDFEKLAGYFENWREFGKNKRCQRFKIFFQKSHTFQIFKINNLNLKSFIQFLFNDDYE